MTTTATYGHTKMAADDFIGRYGEDAFSSLICNAMQPPSKPRPLGDYRDELAKVRCESVGKSGVFLDTSPTGSGKTTADIPAVTAAQKSLTVLPTHKNCRDVREAYLAAGLEAEAFPKLDKDTCSNIGEAVQAIKAGLSVSSALCPTCLSASQCEYKDAQKAAEATPHCIATHQRARMGFASLAKGRPYITIHESPIDLLRPTEEISDGLELVAEVARTAKDLASDRNDMDLRWFFWRMEDNAHWLSEQLLKASDTTILNVPLTTGTPRTVDARLFQAMQSCRVWPDAGATRIVRAIAAGELAEIIVRVDHVLTTGQQSVVARSIVAVWQTDLPKGVPIWLSDATADTAEIESVVGRPVVEMTPKGHLVQQHTVLQIATDVKQSTAAGTVVKLLRGFLIAYPEPQRIGIICHRKHVTTISGTSHKRAILDETFCHRIAKVEYFHGGESCGSNQWIWECDLIIVLGTPRVPPSVIKSRLLQTGRANAAARNGQWEPDYWSGITTTGKRRTVRTSAYRDHDWHAAHCSIVRSELIQAVGRGRGICSNGVPVVVLSNEPLGFPLLDCNIEPITEPTVRAIRMIQQLSEQNPTGVCRQQPTEPSEQNLIYIIGSCSVSSAQIATALKLTDRRVRYILDDLLHRGLIERIGKRGGWRLTNTGRVFLLPAQSSEVAAAAGQPIDDDIEGGMVSIMTPLRGREAARHRDAGQVSGAAIDDPGR